MLPCFRGQLTSRFTIKASRATSGHGQDQETAAELSPCGRSAGVVSACLRRVRRRPACAGPASSSRSISDACDAGSLAGDAVAPPGVSPGAGDLYSGSATGRAARPTLAPPTWLALLSAMSALYLRPSYGGTAGGVACGGSVPVPPSFGCQKPARVQGVVARPPIWIDIR